AVLYRKGGGHVGVVSGFDIMGNPVVISGNHGHRVYESVYPRSRVLAYVTPTNVAPRPPEQHFAGFGFGDAAHSRIVEVPPARARQRPRRDDGGGGTAPSVVKLQERNHAPRIDRPSSTCAITRRANPYRGESPYSYRGESAYHGETSYAYRQE